jgi:hypothetical protein
MGWASRSRVGLWQRTQQARRRSRLAHNLLPRLILHQMMHLVVALAMFPVRLVRHVWDRVHG